MVSEEKIPDTEKSTCNEAEIRCHSELFMLSFTEVFSRFGKKAYAFLKGGGPLGQTEPCFPKGIQKAVSF